MELEKTTHMNLLMEFYGMLLTTKQMDYIERYYADDYSLGEIAEEYSISRQAVYDNIKRTGNILEEYERKLHLVNDFYKRQELYDQIEAYVGQTYADDRQLLDIIAKLQKSNR